MHQGGGNSGCRRVRIREKIFLRRRRENGKISLNEKKRGKRTNFEFACTKCSSWNENV